MSFTPNFSIVQSQSSPNLITISDTSVGSDNTVVKARVYFQESNGTYLVPTGTSTNYVQIACNGSGKFATTIIDLLNRDYALSVQVDWLDNVNTVKYTLTQVFLFKAYSENFDYGLVSDMASAPYLATDAIFMSNKTKVRLLIDSAEQAINYGTDINAAQFCLDDLYNIISNQSFYFPN